MTHSILLLAYKLFSAAATGSKGEICAGDRALLTILKTLAYLEREKPDRISWTSREATIKLSNERDGVHLYLDTQLSCWLFFQRALDQSHERPISVPKESN
jgi:hypothetical protein